MDEYEEYIERKPLRHEPPPNLPNFFESPEGGEVLSGGRISGPILLMQNEATGILLHYLHYLEYHPETNPSCTSEQFNSDSYNKKEIYRTNNLYIDDINYVYHQKKKRKTTKLMIILNQFVYSKVTYSESEKILKPYL